MTNWYALLQQCITNSEVFQDVSQLLRHQNLLPKDPYPSWWPLFSLVGSSSVMSSVVVDNKMWMDVGWPLIKHIHACTHTYTHVCVCVGIYVFIYLHKHTWRCCHITWIRISYLKERKANMEQSPSWEANMFLGTQEIPCILWNLKVHYLIHKSCDLSLF